MSKLLPVILFVTSVVSATDVTHPSWEFDVNRGAVGVRRFRSDSFCYTTGTTPFALVGDYTWRGIVPASGDGNRKYQIRAYARPCDDSDFTTVDLSYTNWWAITYTCNYTNSAGTAKSVTKTSKKLACRGFVLPETSDTDAWARVLPIDNYTNTLVSLTISSTTPNIAHKSKSVPNYYWYDVTISGEEPAYPGDVVSGDISIVKEGEDATSRQYIGQNTDFTGFSVITLDEKTKKYSMKRFDFGDATSWDSADLSASSAKLPVSPKFSDLAWFQLVTNETTSAETAERNLTTSLVYYDPVASGIAGYFGATNKFSIPFASANAYVDVLVVPQGYMDASLPSGGRTMSGTADIFVCTEDFINPLVWRYRRNRTGVIPVDLEHASITNATGFTPMGRVAGMWYDDGGVFTNHVVHRKWAPDVSPGSGSSLVTNGWHWLVFGEEDRVMRNDPGVYARIELSTDGFSLLTSDDYDVSPQIKTTTRSIPSGDRVTIPWQITSIAFTKSPKLPTGRACSDDIVPFEGGVPGVPGSK